MTRSANAQCDKCDGQGFVHIEGTTSCSECLCRIEARPRCLLEAAGVPPRYLDVSLENLKPENPAQETALATLKQFVATWSDRQTLGEGIALLGTGSRVGKTHFACAAARSVAK